MSRHSEMLLVYLRDPISSLADQQADLPDFCFDDRYRQITRALATGISVKAVIRLRQDERASARAELKDAFDEVRRADDAIVRIANLLPMNLRKQIASARMVLTRSILALTSQIRGGLGPTQDEPPRE